MRVDKTRLCNIQYLYRMQCDYVLIIIKNKLHIFEGSYVWRDIYVICYS